MSNLFPSNSRELPVFPAVLGNMSISRLFANFALVVSENLELDGPLVVRKNLELYGPLVVCKNLELCEPLVVC